MRLPKVLICDDDPLFHLSVKNALKKTYEARSAYHGEEALAILRNHPIDVVLLDVQMRTPDEGLALIPRLKEIDPTLAIVMSSGLADFGTVREAMRRGANDYVPKGFEPEELHLALERMLAKRELESRNARQSSEVALFQRKYPLVGRSEALRRVREQIEKSRASQAPVLIQGETGTGKEAVARGLRPALSDGALAPFVVLDGATLVSSLAESQLFGFEKGAFTGADRATRGLIEEADGGVLFIDELGEIPLPLQAKLLRVIQEQEVTRLGSTRPRPLDFRVVSATHRDLEAAVAAGQFREDLFQRLNVLRIKVPPLRSRVEDIPELVDHFMSLAAPRKRFTEEALDALRGYRWPGNVRELGNLVESMRTLVEDGTIEREDLPGHIRDSRAEYREADAIQGFYAKVARFESELLRSAYDKLAGNISRMSQELGMDRSHLYTKLKAYGIRRAGSGGG